MSEKSSLKVLSETDCEEPPPYSECVGSPNYVNHHNVEHFSTCFSMLNHLRMENVLCDITLIVGNVTLKAHKLILASVSPYFYAMFNGELVEKDKNEVVLHNIDSQAFRLLIEYTYTGNVTITGDNVQVLLPASNLLQINSVTEQCCKFLMKQLHPTNCLGIRNFADIHLCEELHRRSHEYVLINFHEVMKTDEFFLLSFEELLSIVSSDQLNAPNEESVYTAVIDWLKHCFDEREQHATKLLQHIRFPLMQKDFVMNYVEPESVVKSDPNSKEYLMEVMKYYLMPEERKSLISFRTKERYPDGVSSHVFAIGGGSLFAIHSECECYNPELNQWFSVSPMLFRRSRAGVTAIGKKIYVIGGYDGASDLSSCECYDPNLNKWSSITSMGTRRSCLGACDLNGLLYVCGGYDGASCLSDVQRYDPLTGEWTSCPTMSIRRRYCRVAVVDGCLYALGGFDTNTYQASVERLDPRMKRWESIPSMNNRRSSSGVAALNGMLYCIGGNDGTMCMSNGERFNIKRNAWEPIVGMNMRRSTHELIELNGKLLAIGGNDGSASHSTVEMYDPKENQWTFVAPMATKRSSVGAAVVKCFTIEVKETLKKDCTNSDLKQKEKNEISDSTQWFNRSPTTSIKK